MTEEKMSPPRRPKLETTDIYRAQGPTWRLVPIGTVSLSQLKVMSAIRH